MKLSRIHHIAIIVSDFFASKNFYVEKLGFKITESKEKTGNWI